MSLGQPFDLDTQAQLSAADIADWTAEIFAFADLAAAHTVIGPDLARLSDAFLDLAIEADGAGDPASGAQHRRNVELVEAELREWVTADQSLQEWGPVWQAVSSALGLGVTMEGFETGGLAGIGQTGLVLTAALLGAALGALVVFNISTRKSLAVATEMQAILDRVARGELTAEQGAAQGQSIVARERQRTQGWLPSLGSVLGDVGMFALLGVGLLVLYRMGS